MIRVSSNSAADWAYYRTGDARLRRLARRADMDQFSICCWWTHAYFSARDQAKFFWRLERLTPRRFRDYATRLLRSIVPRQSWGIPSVGRPRGFSVFFKGGWRGTGLGQLVHQASFVRYRGTRLLPRRADGRQPVDELRHPDDRGRRAQDPALEAGLARLTVRRQVRVAGEESTFPAASFARTENVCEPREMPV